MCDMVLTSIRGPRTLFSIFSRLGLTWIKTNLPEIGASDSLLALLAELTASLRISPDSGISLREIHPEPSEENAKRYYEGKSLMRLS